jgi:hypothetical protein
MRVKEEFTEAQRRFGLLSFYDKFEHIVILILTVLIAVLSSSFSPSGTSHPRFF